MTSAASWGDPLAAVVPRARAAWPTHPTPTPAEAARRAVADDVALRAARLATGPAADQCLARTAQEAVRDARARLAAMPAPAGAPWLQHLPRVAQAAGVALLLGQLSQEGWLGRTTLLSVGNYLPNWRGRLTELPAPVDEALGAAVRRAEADQVLYAQQKLVGELCAATCAFGPPVPGPAPAAGHLWRRGPGTSSRAAAAREVEALAGRLDGQRRRLHHVAARLRCRAAVAALAAADPRLAAHASAQRRGLQVAAVAVTLSFVVGYYAQFASVVGLGLVGVVLAVAVAALAYNLRAALDYVAGKAGGRHQESEVQRERERTLAALAEARLVGLAAPWQAQRRDEQELAELRQTLANLEVGAGGTHATPPPLARLRG